MLGVSGYATDGLTSVSYSLLPAVKQTAYLIRLALQPAKFNNLLRKSLLL